MPLIERKLFDERLRRHQALYRQSVANSRKSGGRNLTNVLEVILHNHPAGRYLSNMIIARQCKSSSAWKGVWMSKHCSMVAQASASGSDHCAGQSIVSKAINMGAPFRPTSSFNCRKEDAKYLHMDTKTVSRLRDALDDDLARHKLPKLPLSARACKNKGSTSPQRSPRRRGPYPATSRACPSSSISRPDGSPTAKDSPQPNSQSKEHVKRGQ